MIRFVCHKGGSTALEFALISPVFVALLLGGLTFATVMWRQNVLQEVANEASRCIAMAIEECTSANTPSAFIVRLAQARGLSGLDPQAISVDRSASVDGAEFTRVTLQYPMQILQFRTILNAECAFPNGG